MARKKRTIDSQYYLKLDSHVKVDRMFLQHVLKVLEGRRNGEYKDKLIEQLRDMIYRNMADIWKEDVNSSLNHLL